MTLLELLCVGIAKELFIKVTEVKSKDVVEDSREVIKSWRECEIESVRMKGIFLTREGHFKSKRWAKMLLE
jgi:hypothetical protein